MQPRTQASSSQHSLAMALSILAVLSAVLALQVPGLLNPLQSLQSVLDAPLGTSSAHILTQSFSFYLLMASAAAASIAWARVLRPKHTLLTQSTPWAKKFQAALLLATCALMPAAFPLIGTPSVAVVALLTLLAISIPFGILQNKVTNTPTDLDDASFQPRHAVTQQGRRRTVDLHSGAGIASEAALSDAQAEKIGVQVIAPSQRGQGRASKRFSLHARAKVSELVEELKNEYNSIGGGSFVAPLESQTLGMLIYQGAVCMLDTEIRTLPTDSTSEWTFILRLVKDSPKLREKPSCFRLLPREDDPLPAATEDAASRDPHAEPQATDSRSDAPPAAADAQPDPLWTAYERSSAASTAPRRLQTLTTSTEERELLHFECPVTHSLSSDEAAGRTITLQFDAYYAAGDPQHTWQIANPRDTLVLAIQQQLIEEGIALPSGHFKLTFSSGQVINLNASVLLPRAFGALTLARAEDEDSVAASHRFQFERTPAPPQPSSPPTGCDTTASEGMPAPYGDAVGLLVAPAAPPTPAASTLRTSEMVTLTFQIAGRYSMTLILPGVSMIDGQANLRVLLKSLSTHFPKEHHTTVYQVIRLGKALEINQNHTFDPTETIMILPVLKGTKPDGEKIFTFKDFLPEDTSSLTIGSV